MKKLTQWINSHLSRRDLRFIMALEGVLIFLLLAVGLMATMPLQLELTGEKEMTLYCGDSFRDPGAVATVNGKNVEVTVMGRVNPAKPGTYTLVYQAQFLMTSREVTRIVQVLPLEMPVLTLEGEQEVTLKVGDAFLEPGFRATDGAGRDLTDGVQISGNVDTANAGSYLLTYTVTDAMGQTVRVQRKVIVEAAPQTEFPEPTGQVIYLTFDDGPSAYTLQLLQVLEKYGAKATFFVVDTGRSDAGDIMRQIVAGGHAIGIHSKSHDYSKIYVSEEAFLEDLYAMQALIEAETGVKTMLMRFPGGSSNTTSKKYCKGIMTQLVQTVTDLHFRYFDWNVDSDDAGKARTPEEVYRNVTKALINAGGRRNNFVLMHDTKGYSVEAVEQIIIWGLENGYTFEALNRDSYSCRHVVFN